MNVATMDGIAYFPTHAVTLESGEVIMCFSLDEFNNFMLTLENGYTVEELQWDNSVIEKTKGKIFNSRTELIEFLQNDIIPESEIIPNLKKENEELKTKLSDTENALLGVMFS